MDRALLATGGSTEWETPNDFFETINGVFRFDIDVCATADNTKCERYFTKEQDGLSQDWLGTVWCNPPYGRNVEKWVSRARDSRAINDATVVMLLPARTDTKWVHKYVFGSAHVIFLKGRLKFGGGGNSAPFPSMLAIWGGQAAAAKLLADRLDGWLVIGRA